MSGIICVTYETGEIQQFAFHHNGTMSPFERIEEIEGFVDATESQHNKKIRFIELVFETASISSDAAKLLKNRLGVELRRVNGAATHVVAICTPKNIASTLLTIFSAVDVGEKLEKINIARDLLIVTDTALKAKAQSNVKMGAIRPDCPLLAFIVKENGLPVTGENLEKVRVIVEKMPDRKEILALAYREVFKEEMPDPKKDVALKDLFMTSDDDFAELAKAWRRK